MSTTVNEEKVTKSGKSTRSDLKRKRSTSGVPTMRDGSDAGGDNVRRVRLSRVQRSDSGGESEKVEKGNEVIRRAEPLVGIERQIAKLNAYRSLLKKSFSLRGVPDDLEKEILDDFRRWVEHQVLVMMGRAQPLEDPRAVSSPFDHHEIETLKAMAAKVRGKLNPSEPKKPQQYSNEHIPQPNLDARPLAERSGVRFNPNVSQEEQLRHLDEMDRRGPNF